MEHHLQNHNYKQYQEELTDSVDGGGCAEVWETLSKNRHRAKDESEKSQQDIEAELIDLGCLRPKEDGDDLELDSSFRHAWRSTISDLSADELGRLIGNAFAFDHDVQINETDRGVEASHDGHVFGWWESRPALIADLGTCLVLEDRDEVWDERSAEERSRFASGIRLYLESCPDCRGKTIFGTEEAASCCDEYRIATVSCRDCGATLFETPVPTRA